MGVGLCSIPWGFAPDSPIEGILYGSEYPYILRDFLGVVYPPDFNFPWDFNAFFMVWITSSISILSFNFIISFR